METGLFLVSNKMHSMPGRPGEKELAAQAQRPDNSREKQVVYYLVRQGMEHKAGGREHRGRQ